MGVGCVIKKRTGDCRYRGKGVLIGSDGLFPLFGRLGEWVSACKRTRVCQIMN